MPHIFVVFGGLFTVIFMMLACVDDPNNTNIREKIHTASCTKVPDDKKDHVADLVIQCVNNATAKNTGENQDADDWVEACKEQIVSIYQVYGVRKYTGGDMDPQWITGCEEFSKDSSLTKQ